MDEHARGEWAQGAKRRGGTHSYGVLRPCREVCSGMRAYFLTVLEVPAFVGYITVVVLDVMLNIRKSLCENLHGISPLRQEREFSKAEATIARLTFLVDAPTFDASDPFTDDLLIALVHKVIKVAAYSITGRYQEIIGAIQNRAPHAEPVEDERSTEGLVRQAVESDDRIVWVAAVSMVVVVVAPLRRDTGAASSTSVTPTPAPGAAAAPSTGRA